LEGTPLSTLLLNIQPEHDKDHINGDPEHVVVVDDTSVSSTDKDNDDSDAEKTKNEQDDDNGNGHYSGGEDDLLGEEFTTEGNVDQNTKQSVENENFLKELNAVLI